MTDRDRFRDNGFRLSTLKEAVLTKKRVAREQKAAVAKSKGGLAESEVERNG